MKPNQDIDAITKLRKEIGLLSKKELFNFVLEIKINNDSIPKEDFANLLSKYKIKFSKNNIDQLYAEEGFLPAKAKISIYKIIEKMKKKAFDPIKTERTNYVYRFLYNIHLNYHEDFTVDILINNFSIKDDKEEFREIFKMFHYKYNNLSTPIVTKEEFIDFFMIISLLYDSSIEFTKMIENAFFINEELKTKF